MLRSPYPTKPLSPIPAIYLEAFLAERAYEDADYGGTDLDSFAAQRTYALYQGAAERARTCGELRGHDAQAAALLVSINDLDNLLAGAHRCGGHREVMKGLETGEMQDLTKLLETLKLLLVWHFENGAGELLPIAEWMGLTMKEPRA